MASNWCKITAKYLRQQTKQLAAQFHGICANKDIEFIHRARVSIRRIRAALELLEDRIPAKKLKKWRKAIRHLGKFLGPARDLDVQIQYLNNVSLEINDKQLRPGIRKILKQFKRKRQRLQPGVVRAVRLFEQSHTLKDIRRAAKAISRQTACADNLQLWLSSRVNELMLYADSLKRPAYAVRQHKMRIAAKHLRYSLEILKPAQPQRFDEAIEASKTIQNLLGEVHDCDVWLDQLDKFVRKHNKSRKAMNKILPGIDFLHRDRLTHRRESLTLLAERWKSWAEKRIWEGICDFSWTKNNS